VGPRVSSKTYLHVHSGRWQWTVDDADATVELREVGTHRTILELPAALVAVVLMHYYGGAELAAALAPALAQLPRRSAPGPHALGQPRLRGQDAEKRRLRGRKRGPGA